MSAQEIWSEVLYENSVIRSNWAGGSDLIRKLLPRSDGEADLFQAWFQNVFDPGITFGPGITERLVARTAIENLISPLREEFEPLIQWGHRRTEVRISRDWVSANQKKSLGPIISVSEVGQLARTNELITCFWAILCKKEKKADSPTLCIQAPLALGPSGQSLAASIILHCVSSGDLYTNEVFCALSRAGGMLGEENNVIYFE